ncbi:MAG: redoxin domain-containing protein, partial [Pirellulales bacterium]
HFWRGSSTMRPTSMITAVLACVGLVLGVSCSPVAAATPQQPPTVGHAVERFELKDLQGVTVSLAELRDAPLVVVVFMGVECPLAKLYAPRLSELSQEYGKRGVVFLAIDSNAQDSLAEMSHFARTYQLTIPFLKDSGNGVADQFRAERTPEAFVLDGERVVRYRGRIDDQYGFQTGVGYQRKQAVERELAEAIEQLLAGNDVAESVTRAPGCLIGRVQAADEQAEVTFSNQIARLFQDRCVHCHREGEIAPFSLSNYAEVVGWAPMIDEVVREQRMPPWHADPAIGHFANDSRLSDEEKQMIADWVAAGAPEGDPSDLPAPKQFTSGWQIAPPDRVIAMADKLFEVPAEGKVEYQYFVADPEFTEDVWVSEAEARPGNNAVVHHIIVFIVPPGAPVKQMGEGMGSRDLLVGTAPGNPPTRLAPGMAKRIRAGSKLLFQMHYTANGAQQQDLSSVGLVFADPASVNREVQTDLAINHDFEIPAGDGNHAVPAWRKFASDTLILSFMPHLHLRGKAFRYDLQYPDGRVETLLDIPRYDFNWQNTYVLAEPKFVPKGARLHCVAHFDNSEENLANPDPTQPVGWGEQTWEEMMIGWFVRTSVDETPNLAALLAEQDRQKGANAPADKAAPPADQSAAVSAQP